MSSDELGSAGELIREDLEALEPSEDQLKVGKGSETRTVSLAWTVDR